MKVLIVEDEPLYRNHLCILVDKLGHEVVAAVDNALDALAAAKTNQPDLALLDVHLAGDHDGIETGTKLRELGPIALIFITSQSDDLTFKRARRLGSINFLLKPFDELQVQRAIELTELSGDNYPPNPPMKEHFIYVKTGNHLRKIHPPDISLVMAQGRYCEIHEKGHKHLVRMPFQEIVDQLPTPPFLRAHRSFLINENFVSAIDLPNSEIILNDNQRIPLAKRQREDFLQRIKKL